MASIALTATGFYSYNPYKEAVSALIWGITPRLVNILTSKPTQSTSKIDRIREKIFGIRTQFLEFTQTNRFTKCTWFVLNDIIVANMGFSTLFVLMNHFINPHTTASSSGVLVFKLLMCIPIAGWREDLCKENKDWSREALPREKAWEVAHGDFNHVQKIVDDELATTFGQIPCILFDKEEFQKRKCAITGRPVRYAVVVRETPTSPPIYYEHTSLPNWIGRTPPNWPASIPFVYDEIVVDEAETAQITEELQKIISRRDIQDKARKCLPKLEEKLREEIGKRIDSLNLPDLFSTLKNLVRYTMPIPQLAEIMWQIELRIEDTMRRRMDEFLKGVLLGNRISKATDYPEGIEDTDPILSKWTCAVSHQAIRFPVTDITNGKTIYDVQSIKLWLIISNESPITRIPLDKEAALANVGCIYDPLINYRKYCLAQNELQDKNAFTSHITTIIKEVCEAEDIHTISEKAREFLKEGFIYTCPISKRRINNAVKAQQEPGSNPFRRDVYYEQSAIQTYLENPTGQLPLNWPKGVAFCQDNLVEMEEERLLLEQVATVKKDQAEWLESLSS